MYLNSVTVSWPTLASRPQVVAQRAPSPVMKFVGQEYLGLKQQPISRWRDLLVQIKPIPVDKMTPRFGSPMGRLPKTDLPTYSKETLNQLSEQELVNVCYSYMFDVLRVRQNFDPDKKIPSNKPSSNGMLIVGKNQFSLNERLEAIQHICERSPSAVQMILTHVVDGMSLFELPAGQAYYAMKRQDWECFELSLNILNEIITPPTIFTPSTKTFFQKFASKFCTETLCTKFKNNIPPEQPELSSMTGTLLLRTLTLLYPAHISKELDADDVNFLLPIIDTCFRRFFDTNENQRLCIELCQFISPYVNNVSIFNALSEHSSTINGVMKEMSFEDVTKFEQWSKLHKLQTTLRELLDSSSSPPELD